MRRTRDRGAGLIDMISTGLSYDDLSDLTEYRSVTATDPAGLPEHPIVRLGDVWLLGEHRLICGDSTDPVTVRRLLENDRPHLMVTDPPYGVEYSPDWRNHAFRAVGRAVGSVANDSRVDWTAAWRLFPGDVAYVWHSSWYTSNVQQSLEAGGFIIRSQIIWNKSRFVIGRGDYHWKHEPCWHAVRRGAKGHWNAGRDQTTVWDIQHVVSETGHGTQKPIECMRRPIENNSAPGDWVYEPFCGSGTTIIAAEISQRRCLAVELNPLYVYVATARWQNYVGRTATLQETGETFAEVVRRRKEEPPQAVLPLPTVEVSLIDEDFDPVLAEVLCDRWCPLGGTIYDVTPSAVRRLVFEYLRREYRTEACEADLLIFADAPLAISTTSQSLRDNRFAVAIVRAEPGASSRVVEAFREVGMPVYEEMVYIPEDPTERHSIVMVFVKGSAVCPSLTQSHF